MLGLFVRAKEKGKRVERTLGLEEPVQSVIRPGPLRGLMLKAGRLGPCSALWRHRRCCGRGAANPEVLRKLGEGEWCVAESP